MDLIRIAARVANEGIVRIHMNVDPESAEDLDPDGGLAAAFGEKCAELGGSIEDWEGEWLEVQVPASSLREWLDVHLPAMESGQHGPEVQKIAEAYSVTDVVDGEGNDVPWQ